MNVEPEPRSRARRALWIIFLILVVLVLLLLALPKRREGIAEAGEKPVAVRALIVEPRRIADSVQLPGRIEARVEAVLGAEKGGRVAEIAAEKGDRVRAGQVLLRLDSRTWQALLDQAEIEEREARKDFERWQELKKAGAVSASDFDAVRTRRDVAEAARALAAAHVSQCDVKSPIDGTLDDRLVEAGEYATEGLPVFKIVDADTVKLVIPVPEKDISPVRAGEPVSFTVSALGGRSFTAEVSFVSATAARENNAFRVEASAQNPSGELRPGMIAEATLVKGWREDAIVLPLAAVVPRKNEHVVYVVENRRAVRRVVQLDRIVGHEAVIASGVGAGEQVVVEGQRALVDGALLEVAAADPRPEEPPLSDVSERR
jgi:membrane fusion protein (multidrug efflux system)